MPNTMGFYICSLALRGSYVKIAKMQFSSTEVRIKKEVRTFFYFLRSCLPIIILRE
jgi:hypothetical protein